ncbi:2,4'-dihydroxyacetophenone dioxygenase family protein [Paraburkholderia pallida]|uniref:2,4'-dihydroxyacetophenone dioxygenase n=1 Tax=Paraburkholderia pallida TaxID=2547399 RepID=A0A4V1B0U2_9BURK|nr:2,4'-dihydroxyacetophenone dioxygenase family protein [Paraburkholderia pallida]QBR03963.1 2,4'-dihydroxyacetophenone dioxygenase [Paraburkholderia pallida]
MALTAATHQPFLLTFNRHREGEIKDVVPGVHITPCFLDAEKGIWVIYARFEAGTVLPKHFHTGTVHFYTTAGSWNYVEYPDDVQTEGSYLFEPGGSVHTFSSKEGAEGFMVVEGSNVNFDENDNYLYIEDAGLIERVLHEVAKTTGQRMPRYIRPGRGAEFSE